MQLSQKWSIAAFSAVLLLAIGYWYGSPYVALYQLKQAVEEKDAASFNNYVDYPSLRESFKGQFAAKLSQQPRGSGTGAEALGALIGLGLVNQLVDSFVRPEVVMRAMSSGQLAPAPGEARPSPSNLDKEADWASERVDAHTLVLYAVEPGKADLPKEKRFGFVFLRSSFATWKLSEVRIPQE